MSAAWQWQDAACFQSCSASTQQRAAQWLADAPALQQKLVALAAEQPLLHTASDATMLQHIVQHAAQLAQHSQQLVVVGTGGASLGAQALCALSADPTRVRFLENCDPETVARFMQLPCEHTAWLIISKSGETVETLAAALSLIGTHGPALASRLMVITANSDSTLGQLAKQQHWPILTHPARLGGRFSVFSVVGLLPCAYAGLDIMAIAQAAQKMLQQLLQQPDVTLWRHASWIAATMAEKPQQLLMAYADRLRPATQWWKQLWAESLGKQGRGQTPITAIGSIDQHSQLQLYLDGPHDKLVTLWLPDAAGHGPILPTMTLPGLHYLGGHTMGDVMQATAEATVKTLTATGVPLRVLRGELSPASMAEWMVARMLETLAVSVLIAVDPFSQPAVEEGKKLARAALGAA
ncbi:MAG: hypothetical protein ACKVOE_01220 [Rickettsiales bacterium]